MMASFAPRRGHYEPVSDYSNPVEYQSPPEYQSPRSRFNSGTFSQNVEYTSLPAYQSPRPRFNSGPVQYQSVPPKFDYNIYETAYSLNDSSASHKQSIIPSELHKETYLKSSIMRMLWVVIGHLIPITVSAVLMWLNFAQTFWFDSLNISFSFWKILNMNLPGSSIQISENDVLNGLQFGAKLVEMLLVASIVAIVMHGVRWFLISEHGLPMPMLTVGYSLGSPSHLFSPSFWSGCFSRTPWRLKLFAAFVMMCTVLTGFLVGPSSAIMLIPSLTWSDIADPYNGRRMDTYVLQAPKDIYPTTISLSNLNITNCSLTSPTFNCPGGGQDQITAWTITYGNSKSSPNISFVEPIGDTRHTLRVSDGAQDLAVVATSLSLVPQMTFGLFWDYIRSKYNGVVSDAARPKLTTSPQSNPIQSPLVQVQCETWDYMSLRNGTIKELKFPGNNINYFNGTYNDPYRGIVPQSAFNFTHPLAELNFTWVDVDPVDGILAPSIGAVVTLPRWFEDSNTQTSMTVACTIDARWSSSQLIYDPYNSDLIDHNLSAPSFYLYSNNVRSYPDIISQPISIKSNWAELLNTFDKDENATAIVRNLGMMTQKDPKDGTTPTLFSPPSNTPDGSDIAQNYTAAVSRAVATVLSVIIADGLSRVDAYNQSMYTEVDRKGPHNITLANLVFSEGWQAINDTVNSNWTDFNPNTVMSFDVQRYGYSYGYQTSTAKFGLSVMFIYQIIACTYILALFYSFIITRRGWTSNSWSDLRDMIRVAVSTTPSSTTREVLKSSNRVIKAWMRVNAKDAIELVLGRKGDRIASELSDVDRFELVQRGREYRKN